MANWATGSIRMRGAMKDIMNFMDNGIEGVDYIGEKKPDNVTKVDYGGIECAYEFKGTAWIKDTKRAFIDTDTFKYWARVYIEVDEINDETSIAMPFKQAWEVSAEDFVAISKKYSVDVAIHAFEPGMMFEQDILIVGGEIKKNDKNDYKDYKDYMFECTMPFIGG